MSEPRPEGDADDAPLVPPGNRPRWVRGGGITVVGLLAALLASIAPTGPRVGVPLVGLAVLVATLGVLDLLGGFDDEGEPAATVPLGALAAPLGVTALGWGGLFVALRAAVAGGFGADEARARLAMAVVMPALFLVGASGLAWGLARAGVIARDRPLWRQPGLWLVAVVAGVSMPTLGSHSLTDPWETHYGEVAREILAREDWISFWWAHEGWFWSKPALSFWLQSIAMALLGVRYEPGQMLSVAEGGGLPWPEWAVRMPIFVFALVATMILAKAVARVFGWRAGFLAGLALTTMPQWSFLSHQTMTDMPFVAAMTAGIGLAAIGLTADPEARVRVFAITAGRRGLRVSAWHLAVGATVAIALAQIVHLASRNLALGIDPAYGLMWPPIQAVSDTFAAGSPGVCGQPGNPACEEALPAVRSLTPAIQAGLWAQAVALFAWVSWGERRVARLAFSGAWLCVALAVLAKGPAGFALPIAALGAYVFVARRPRALLVTEPLTGLATLVAIALPWYVAAYARHGSPFTDRLLFHDMFKRAFDHVHDTNQGDDTSFRYYVWQLGYATFPWVGLVPLALFGGRTSAPDRGDAPHRTALVGLFAGWFFAGFALFSAIETKFHHYVFPVVPAIAALLGIALDRALGREALAPRRADAVKLALAAAGGVVAVLAAQEWLAGGRLWAVVGGVVAAGCVLSGARRQPPEGAPAEAHERAALGVVAALGAGVTALVGRDLAGARDDVPTFDRLLHLFTYNYERPWPAALDYRVPLGAFTLGASVVLLAGAFPALRRASLAALGAVAIFFAGWSLDVYFVETSPHWGQRGSLLAYAHATREEPGPLVAYQLNWKGENFYTGNAAVGFVSSGKPFRDYLAAERRGGQRVFYVLLMHGRLGALESELGRGARIERLTTRDENNKFLLVRARY